MRLGCEVIVSKRRDAPYRSGRVKTWLKIKNPAAPTATRVWERNATLVSNSRMK
jgi:ATP-dependent DNA ligase